MDTTLETLRKQIDEIDEGILLLLAKRIAVVKEVGKHKKKNGLEILDEKRKKTMITQRIEKAQALQLSSDFIQKLYALIHDYSIDREKEDT